MKSLTKFRREGLEQKLDAGKCVTPRNYQQFPQFNFRLDPEMKAAVEKVAGAEYRWAASVGNVYANAVSHYTRWQDTNAVA